MDLEQMQEGRKCALIRLMSDALERIFEDEEKAIAQHYLAELLALCSGLKHKEGDAQTVEQTLEGGMPAKTILRTAD